MHGSYRSIIFALVGWLALTAQIQAPGDRPKEREDSVQEQRGSDTQQAAATIAGAISNSVQPANKDTGCQQGSDKRESDLCAQWKAADAARDAAQYAFWTLLVSAVGTGLLVWTLWETRANARRELRAYVSVKILGMGISVSGDEVSLSQEAVAHNGGSTPAYNFTSFANFTVSTTEFAAKQFAKPIPIDPDALSGGLVIHAGEDQSLSHDRVPTLPITAIDSVLNGEASVFLYGTLSYVDTFKRRRRTDYCYVLDSDAFQKAWIESRANPEKGIQVIWKTAHFHNTAT